MTEKPKKNIIEATLNYIRLIEYNLEIIKNSLEPLGIKNENEQR